MTAQGQAPCSTRPAMHAVAVAELSSLQPGGQRRFDPVVHYGYRRVHVLLRREGHTDNVKRIYRLYKEEGLSLRLKRPRRNRAAKLRQPKQLAHIINEIWSMDFVADALFDGRKLRMLTVVDLYTRECLAIEVGQALKGEDVVRTLKGITAQRGLPCTIKTDNGSEFISKAMDKWAYERGVELDFSRPGKPTDNAAVESFNGRLRQECLNAHWFLSLADAQAKIEAWRQDYNESRPHSALEWRHLPNSPAVAACKQQRRYQRSRKFLLLSGTESGTGSVRTGSQ
ncbi:MAG: IS3 family transposase [Acidovorax sp.]|nr:IS3 family transposase [Acidovorax sp.]